MAATPRKVTDLPVELQLMIMENLDYPSTVFLSQSCQVYRALVRQASPQDHEEKLACLSAMEKWEQ